jgi:IclR family transcriptional regulator, KDG regulon repressor
MASDTSSLQILDRITTILDCFSPEEPSRTFTAICECTGLPKSTVHRLLAALEARGYLRTEADGTRYQLGHKLLHWSSVAQAGRSLRTEAMPAMYELAQATRESVILSVLDGDVGICLEMVESRQPVKLTMRPGQRLPLHSGASSKVLWAFLSDTEIQHILDQITLTPYMPNTITAPKALLAELHAIRECGYATSFEERDPNAMGIAAPVWDYSGRPIAGLGIAAPLARISPEQVKDFAPIVVDAASRLSARLGLLQTTQKPVRESSESLRAPLPSGSVYERAAN